MTSKSSSHSSPIDSPIDSPLDSPIQKYDEDIHIGGRIDVQKAEDEFLELDAELKKTFSHHSHTIKQLASHQTHKHDLEKGSSSESDEEPFDLEATLRGDRMEAEASGMKFKQIGVLWRDLTVQGMGGQKKVYVKTFPEAFVSFFDVISPLWKLLTAKRKAAQQVDILKSFRGVVKPGEMILVLGRPGSGCTSFLKVISNQRFGYTNVEGEVRYGPFSHEEFSKKYRGEAAYSAEDESNSMLPTLTVGQTLGFALDTKISGKLPAGLSKREFKEKVINMLLRMFNIRVSLNHTPGEVSKYSSFTSTRRIHSLGVLLFEEFPVENERECLSLR
jgi:ATP-binding cassette, subfamily G (WHITE), member 2, PDR